MDLTTTLIVSLQRLCQQGFATPWEGPPHNPDPETAARALHDVHIIMEPGPNATFNDNENPAAKQADRLSGEAPNPSQGYRLTPHSADDVARLLHWANENGQCLTLRADEAALLKTPLWLDLQGLKRVRHYNAANFVIQVESGLTVGELDTLLAAQGQALPLSYPSEARLIDLLAEERPALETGLRGFLRDAVLKTEIATPDGQITVSGADVVKSVTGYDLHKLYIGSQNAFGVITAVTLKLTARPEARQAWRVTFPDFSNAQSFTTTLLHRSFPWSTCEVFHTAERWFVWLEIAGQPGLISEAEALLDTLAIPFERIGQAAASPKPAPLRQWPTETTVIEAALPFRQWPAFCEQVLLEESLRHWHCQARPTAGLVYLIAPLEDSDIRQATSQTLLQRLQTLAERLNGFVQIVQTTFAPSRSIEADTVDATANAPCAVNQTTANDVPAHRQPATNTAKANGHSPSTRPNGNAQVVQHAIQQGGPYRTDAPALLQVLATLNIPQDETAHDLLKSLKQSYDPKGCLLTPYLPL